MKLRLSDLVESAPSVDVLPVLRPEPQVQAATAVTPNPLPAVVDTSESVAPPPTISVPSPGTAVSSQAIKLREQLTPQERAELAEKQLEHGVVDDHPILAVIAEMILYRRRYEDIRAQFERMGQEILDQFEQKAQRIERVGRGLRIVVHPFTSVGVLLIGVAIVALLAWNAGADVALIRVHQPPTLVPTLIALALALGAIVGWALRRAPTPIKSSRSKNW